MTSIYPKLEEEPAASPSKDSKVKAEKPETNVHDLKVPEYTGKPGPIESRSCKDIFFLLLFILSWIGMIIVSAVSIKDGNINRLKYGNDSDNNLCGVKNPDVDLTNQKFLYLFDPTDPYSYRVCLNSCPSEPYQVICASGSSASQVNASDINSLAKYEATILMLEKLNCTLSYASYPILNRCVPDISKLNYTDSSNKSSIEKAISMITNPQSFATEIFSDVFDSWLTILICTFIALGLSFLWLYVIQYFSRFIVWISLAAVNICGIALAAYLWSCYNATHSANSNAQITTNNTGYYNEKILLTVSILLSMGVCLSLLLTIVLRQRIELAIELIDETAKCIRRMPSLILLPLFKYVVIIGISAWTIYIWVMLATSGSKVTAAVNSNLAEYTNSTTTEFSSNQVFNYVTIYMAFWYFWSYNFIVGLAQCIIAGAVASWYWTLDKSQPIPRPVSRSFYRAMRYHLGSMAFGSLIIAIIQTIRTVLAYIQYHLKNYKENKVAQCILTCMQCCFACVESTLRYINTNAYIEIAVYGYGFCEAAKVAFQLLLRNAIRVIVLDRVGDFIFVLSKLGITFLTTVIGAKMLQYPVGSDNSSETGRFWAIPLLLIALIAYIIASVFISVFDLAVQTTLVCFCEDSERNDGSLEKPYYMEKNLKEFIDQKQKQGPKL